jgi:hypothetical protein
MTEDILHRSDVIAELEKYLRTDDIVVRSMTEKLPRTTAAQTIKA